MNLMFCSIAKKNVVAVYKIGFKKGQVPEVITGWNFGGGQLNLNHH